MEKKIEVIGEKLVYQGDCIARYKGFTVFVPHLIPGERAEVVVTGKRKSYAQGRILKLITASQYRVEPLCPYHFCLKRNEHNACGGCSWQHIKYEHQLYWEKKIFKEVCSQIKSAVLDNAGINGLENPWNFRHKIQIPVSAHRGGVISGFYMASSHEIVDIENCQIQSDAGNNVYRAVKRLIRQIAGGSGRTNIRHILIRVNSSSSEGLLCFVTRTNKLEGVEEIKRLVSKELPIIKGIFRNVNSRETNVIMGPNTVKIAGRNSMEDIINGIRYLVSIESFFQTNPAQAAHLYSFVKDLVAGSKVVLDLYSGSGGIALQVAGSAEAVYGIEENRMAVEDARYSAQLNNIKNAKFISGKVENSLFSLVREKGLNMNDAAVIINPPRAGCSGSFLEMLLRVNPKNIVYVSCNPSTLARDIKILNAYEPTHAKIFDMFPHSYHMESVVKLARKIV